MLFMLLLSISNSHGRALFFPFISQRCESWFGHVSVCVPFLLSSLNIFWIPWNSWVNIWVSRVLLPLLFGWWHQQAQAACPPLPNSGPPCFYPESCSSQLELKTSKADVVGSQTNCLIEKIAFLVVFCFSWSSFLAPCFLWLLGTDLSLAICSQQLAIP